MTAVKAKFLIISDTHCCDLRPANDSSHSFRKPLPQADVLLHCGDLTHNGSLDQYRATLGMLGSIDAELKLVIAGNHDKTLDAKYWRDKRSNMYQWEDHPKALDMWKGKEAQDAGVTYLEEGVHQFKLKSGAIFKIYASPYTPEFGGMAFPYEHNEDRFNPEANSLSYTSNIATNPIPDFPGVDIIMTHGPPENILDLTNRNTNAGCQHLHQAVHRARPKIHCFGHIHEGWGAQVVTWDNDKESDSLANSIESSRKIHVDGAEMYNERAVRVDISSSSEMPLRMGEQTLMVNAAIMNVRHQPMNGPWLVELDLQCA